MRDYKSPKKTVGGNEGDMVNFGFEEIGIQEEKNKEIFKVTVIYKNAEEQEIFIIG